MECPKCHMDPDKVTSGRCACPQTFTAGIVEITGESDWPPPGPAPSPALAPGVHLCPQCHGSGAMPAGYRTGYSATLAPEVCDVCDGQQLIRVSAAGWAPFPRLDAGAGEEAKP